MKIKIEVNVLKIGKERKYFSLDNDLTILW